MEIQLEESIANHIAEERKRVNQLNVISKSLTRHIRVIKEFNNPESILGSSLRKIRWLREDDRGISLNCYTGSDEKARHIRDTLDRYNIQCGTDFISVSSLNARLEWDSGGVILVFPSPDVMKQVIKKNGLIIRGET